MTPDELVDVVEVAGFGYGTVVVAIRQFFPHDDLRFAKPEQLLHVTWSGRFVSEMVPHENWKAGTHGTISS
jgi:hypothetical protein